jgi:hypothetical protein
MVLAMAPLLLRAEIGWLWSSTLPRRRVDALAAFACGYAAPWIVLGLLALAAPAPGFVPATAAFAAGAAVVFAWQCSPLRQRCLDACHARPSTRAFGLGMLVDVARWGGRTGALCTATCGPAMLLAACLPGPLHLPAMAGAVVLGVIERRRLPQRPAWRLPLGGGRPFPWETRTPSSPFGA